MSVESWNTTSRALFPTNRTLQQTQEGPDTDKAVLSAMGALRGLPQRFDEAQLQITQLTTSRNAQVRGSE